MINDNNYMDYLKGINVVLIEGESCANCISVKYELTELKKQLNFNLIVLEATESIKEFLDKYEIISVPAIVLFEDDKVIAKTKGYQPKEILELWLEAKLEKR